MCQWYFSIPFTIHHRMKYPYNRDAFLAFWDFLAAMN